MRGCDATDIPLAIERLRPMAVLYERDFIGRHMILEAEGVAFDVLWAKRHFLHLTGLDCTLPRRLYRNGARPVRSEVFFDAVRDGRADTLDVRHAHNRGITADKLSVLPMMLHAPQGVEAVVESASRDYDWFFGSEEWCVGVVLADEPPVDPDAAVHAPRTVRNVTISSRSVARVGARPRPLIGWRLIPPRDVG